MGSTRRALIVGIETYVTTPLSYAGYDALEVHDLLKTYEYQFDCTLLLDDTVTKTSLREHFRNLFQDADENAILVFFYAGHAITSDGSTYFVTPDCEDDPESGLSFHSLSNIIRHNLKSQQFCLLLLDCCHAGAFDAVDVNLQVAYLQEGLKDTTGVILFAAVEAEYQALETDNLAHGIFTYWLLEGLRGKAADAQGNVTTNSLHDYISAVFASKGYKQRLVVKTTVAGPVPPIGEGLAPQTQLSASPILSASKLAEIDNESRHVIEFVRGKELNTHTWALLGYKDSSERLNRLIEWRDNLRRDNPELKANTQFKVASQEINRLQSILASPQIGTVLVKGKIVQEIGKGGFGTVYEVHSPNSQIYAYKIFHANLLHERDRMKAFVTGYKAMKRLDHPNIVKVHELTYAPLGFYMDYVDGQNFRDWWSDDYASIIEILYIVAQTLQYAHSHFEHILHRDIKPENIIVKMSDGRAVPYLTDFDLAWYSMATVYSTIGNMAAFGHYLYAAPEQIERPNSDSTRKPTSDVYGFGRLCYFAACGEDPDQDTTQSINSLKAKIGVRWPNGEAAKRFVEIYTKCIRYAPSDRYQSMDEVCTDLLYVRGILIDPDLKTILDQGKFIDELLFSLFGFNLPQTKLVFASNTQRTQIEIVSISPRTIKLRFEVTVGYSGAPGTFEQQRNSINRRIDDVLKRFEGELKASRTNGQRVDVYGCEISVIEPALTYVGVKQIRDLISRTIKAIEN